MKKAYRILLFLSVLTVILSSLAISALATEALPTEGYCYTATPGEQTNVKWTIKTVDDVSQMMSNSAFLKVFNILCRKCDIFKI